MNAILCMHKVGFTMRTVLEAKDLWKSFELTKAVQGISLTVYANDFIAVLGKSGSGKTTLLR